jgi:hypothetical protein
MIYDEEDLDEKLAAQFFLFNANYVGRVIRKKKGKYETKPEAKKRREKSETPVNRQPGFQSSQWGKLYKRLKAIPGGPSIGSREGKLFRRRFRVPWRVFEDLVQKCKDKKLFGPNSLHEVDCCQTEICPVYIKLMGVLRILGRNWCPDDVAEATGMSLILVYVYV